MLNIQFGRTQCKISLLFPAVLLLLLVGDKTGVACYSVLAACLHELGHFMLLLLFGCSIERLTISFYGIRLSSTDMEGLSSAKAIAVFAAGPLVNSILCLVILISNGNTVNAVIHALLAAMNVLPIMPLDGGQIVRCVCGRILCAEKAEQWTTGISIATWIVMTILGLVMWVMTVKNATLFMTAIYIGVCMLFYKGN